jgi:3-oxoadipyl-CoA thiolase
MPEAFICDAVRTPIGRYAGALAKVRTDDLAAVPLKALMARNPKVDWSKLDEVYFGCANQAGEDNRNVARMALLLAGLPANVPGATLNRLCASGLNAVGAAAQAIRAGDIDFAIAGGVESMTRAPFVQGKATEAFSRAAEIYDTTIGWRFINPLMKKQYGVDAMPETGENVAEEFQVTRADQDKFAWRSQQRAGKAIAAGYFSEEIVPVEIAGKTPVKIEADEHPRPETTLDCTWPSARHVGCPHRAHGGASDGKDRWQARARHHVRRRRPGCVARDGARLAQRSRRQRSSEYGPPPAT